MNEQRPRLLPFRLRRERVRRAAPGEYRADLAPEDAELHRLLGAWQAPPPPAALRARLAESFRATPAPAPRWRRLLAARVSVPLPVAACAAAALVVSSLALAALASKRPRPAAEGAGAASAVRFVEVPVPHERVVTRVVYVERAPRPTSPRRAPARPAPREGKEADDAAGPTSYFTGVDMAEFRPADEMKIRVIKKARPDEEERKAR
jgi:hypothetical protein